MLPPSPRQPELVQSPNGQAYYLDMTAIGIALLVVGVIVVLVEAHVPSLGMLGGPGVVALSAGAVLAVAGLGGGIALALVAGILLAGTGIGVLGLSISKGVA